MTFELSRSPSNIFWEALIVVAFIPGDDDDRDAYACDDDDDGDGDDASDHDGVIIIMISKIEVINKYCRKKRDLI